MRLHSMQQRTSSHICCPLGCAKNVWSKSVEQARHLVGILFKIFLAMSCHCDQSFIPDYLSRLHQMRFALSCVLRFISWTACSISPLPMQILEWHSSLLTHGFYSLPVLSLPAMLPSR